MSPFWPTSFTQIFGFQRARGVICRAPEPHDISSRDRSVYVITASARSEKAEAARRVWVNMEGCCDSCQPTLYVVRETERETKRERENAVTMFSQKQDKKLSPLVKKGGSTLTMHLLSEHNQSFRFQNVYSRQDRVLKKIVWLFFFFTSESVFLCSGGTWRVRVPIGCKKYPQNMTCICLRYNTSAFSTRQQWQLEGTKRSW